MRTSARVKEIINDLENYRPAWVRKFITEFCKDEFKNNDGHFKNFEKCKTLIDEADKKCFAGMSWVPFFDAGRHAIKEEFFKEVVKIVKDHTKNEKIMAYAFFYAAACQTTQYGGFGNGEHKSTTANQFINLGSAYMDGCDYFSVNSGKTCLIEMADKKSSCHIITK